MHPNAISVLAVLLAVGDLHFGAAQDVSEAHVDRPRWNFPREVERTSRKNTQRNTYSDPGLPPNGLLDNLMQTHGSSSQPAGTPTPESSSAIQSQKGREIVDVTISVYHKSPKIPHLAIGNTNISGEPGATTAITTKTEDSSSRNIPQENSTAASISVETTIKEEWTIESSASTTSTTSSTDNLPDDSAAGLGDLIDGSTGSSISSAASTVTSAVESPTKASTSFASTKSTNLSTAIFDNLRSSLHILLGSSTSSFVSVASNGSGFSSADSAISADSSNISGLNAASSTAKIAGLDHPDHLGLGDNSSTENSITATLFTDTSRQTSIPANLSVSTTSSLSTTSTPIGTSTPINLLDGLISGLDPQYGATPSGTGSTALFMTVSVPNTSLSQSKTTSLAPFLGLGANTTVPIPTSTNSVGTVHISYPPSLNFTSASGTETRTGMESSTGTETRTGMESSTGTKHNTGMESSTDTKSSTGTQTRTGMESSTGTKSSTGTQTRTGMESSTGTKSNTGMESSTGTNSSTGTDTRTGMESSTGTKSSTGTDTRTGMESNTGTKSNTGMESSTGTNSSTGTDTRSGMESSTGTKSSTGTQTRTGMESSTGTKYNTGTEASTALESSAKIRSGTVYGPSSLLTLTPEVLTLGHHPFFTPLRTFTSEVSTAKSSEEPQSAQSATSAPLTSSDDWMPSTILKVPTFTATVSSTSDQTKKSEATSLPSSITPSNEITEAPSDSVLLQLGFDSQLPWSFVINTPLSSSQIFNYTPQAIENALPSLSSKDSPVMLFLEPYYNWQSTGYNATLAIFYFPRDKVDLLRALKVNPNSALYNQASKSIQSLMSKVDPTIPLEFYGNYPSGVGDSTGGGSADNSEGGSDSRSDGGTTNNDGSASISKTNPSSIGIGVGVVASAAAYGAGMFWVARRYRKRKQLHQHSHLTSKQVKQGGSAAGPILAAAAGGRVPGQSSRGTARSQTISGPAMVENSLGWN